MDSFIPLKMAVKLLLFRIRYNGNNGRFVNRPYEMTKVSGNIHDVGEQSSTLRKDRIFGRITKQAMPAAGASHRPTGLSYGK